MENVYIYTCIDHVCACLRTSAPKHTLDVEREAQVSAVLKNRLAVPYHTAMGVLPLNFVRGVLAS